MKYRHHLAATIVALAACTALGQVINIPQSALLPPGDPGMTPWLAQDAGLIGPTDMRMIAEVTGTAIANSMLLDIQNDGFPGTGGTTNDLVVFQPADAPGAEVSVDIPPNCGVAIFHDVYDETGEFLSGPNGILNVNPVPGTSDAYLCSHTDNNYTEEGRRQMVKYLPVSSAHSYRFTSQWGTVTQLGSGYRLFLFFDDDHSPNYDYDDIIVGVIAPPCVSDGDCADNDLCNGVETCVEGVCLPGTPVDCNDGNFCNGAETCTEGICGAGIPPTCDDAVPCTVDACADNACVHSPSDALCSGDELFCNGVESCDALFGCVSSGNPCEPNQICDEDQNQCRTCEVDADCNDANPCTLGEACVNGACVPGESVDCTASNTQCSVASCDPQGDIGNCSVLTPLADGHPCEDGVECTVNEQCQGGICDEGEGVYDFTRWPELADCIQGPGVGVAEHCQCFDFNVDSAVDLQDVAEFGNLLQAE